jgi:hypothetical protein
LTVTREREAGVSECLSRCADISASASSLLALLSLNYVVVLHRYGSWCSIIRYDVSRHNSDQLGSCDKHSSQQARPRFISQQQDRLQILPHRMILDGQLRYGCGPHRGEPHTEGYVVETLGAQSLPSVGTSCVDIRSVSRHIVNCIPTSAGAVIVWRMLLMENQILGFWASGTSGTAQHCYLRLH